MESRLMQLSVVTRNQPEIAMPHVLNALPHGLSLPPDGEAHAYADGACSGNPGPGGWGSLVVLPGSASLNGGGEGQTTNNRMELTAAADAVVRAASAPGVRRVTVHVDSTYVKDGIQSWITGWKRKGWRTASGAPVKNKELWLALDRAVSDAAGHGVAVGFAWVKGHAGHPGNEACDAEARRQIGVLRRNNSPGRLAGAAAIATLLLFSLHTRAEAAGMPDRAAPKGSFVVSRPSSADDWEFIMGPVGSPDMVLRLSRRNPEGAMAFQCSRRTGEMRVAIAVHGVKGTPGEAKDLNVAVGAKEETLHTKAAAFSAAGVPTVFEADGPAVPDILSAMSTYGQNLPDSRIRADDGEGHVLSMGLTEPRDLAGNAARICIGWRQAAESAHAAGNAGSPGPSVGGAVHVPGRAP